MQPVPRETQRDRGARRRLLGRARAFLGTRMLPLSESLPRYLTWPPALTAASPAPLSTEEAGHLLGCHRGRLAVGPRWAPHTSLAPGHRKAGRGRILGPPWGALPEGLPLSESVLRTHDLILRGAEHTQMLNSHFFSQQSFTVT